MAALIDRGTISCPRLSFIVVCALTMANAAHATVYDYTISPGSTLGFSQTALGSGSGNEIEALSGSFTIDTASERFNGSVTLAGTGSEAGTYTCANNDCTAIAFNNGQVSLFFTDPPPNGILGFALIFSGYPGSTLTITNQSDLQFYYGSTKAIFITEPYVVSGGAELVPEPSAIGIVIIGLAGFASIRHSTPTNGSRGNRPPR